MAAGCRSKQGSRRCLEKLFAQCSCRGQPFAPIDLALGPCPLMGATLVCGTRCVPVKTAGQSKQCQRTGSSRGLHFDSTITSAPRKSTVLVHVISYLLDLFSFDLARFHFTLFRLLTHYMYDLVQYMYL